jgi:hypothetical protein
MRRTLSSLVASLSFVSVLMALGVLLVPVCAQAAQTRELVRSFGAGELSLVAPNHEAEPKTAGSGLAIDQATHDIYVADTGNHRVSEFEANGTFVRAFGKNVGGLGVDVCGGLVSCEAAGTEGAEPGAFTTPAFLAVDNDPASPSFHDVYVGDTGDDVVSKFSEEGVLEQAWGTGGQLKGTGAAELGSLMGVAVDGGGRLLVLGTQDEGNAQEFVFDQAAGFVEEFRLERTPAPNGIAVDAQGDFFKVNGDGSVDESTAAGAEIGTVTPDTEGSPPRANAIAVEPASGGLFVANAAGTIDHYAFNGAGQVLEPDGSACTPAPTVGCAASDSTSISFAGSGIAVSSATGDTYVANPSTGEVSEYGPPVTVPDVVTGTAGGVGPESAMLTGTVKPDGLPVTVCEFEYLSDAMLKEQFGFDFAEILELGLSAAEIYTLAAADVSHVSCEHPGVGEITGSSAVGVHANVGGLAEGVTYNFRLSAANANDANSPTDGEDQAFTTATPPAIEAATALNITESSATLNAKVDPDHEELESCSFEYGTSTEYETVVPCTPSLAQIGSGGTSVPITVAIAKLKPNVTYHWAVVAKNAAGTNAKVDHTFIDDTSGGGLPDNRAYELVSPGRKNGALLGEESSVISHGHPYSIAPDGARLFSEAIQCFAGASSCNPTTGNLLGNVFEFKRTSAGWVTTPLTPAAGSGFYSAAYWSANATSDAALFTMPTEPLGEDDFYAREPESGRFLDIGPNTPPEDGAQGPVGGFDGGQGVAVTSDLSHIVWETPARWPFDERTGPQGLYEYVGAGNKEPLQVGVTGAYEEGKNHNLISACGDALVNDDASPGEISEDGKTVFFTAQREGAEGSGPPCPSGTGENKGRELLANMVYARVDGETSNAHTVAISRPEAPGECATGEPTSERTCRELTSPSECGPGAQPQEEACRKAVGKPARAFFEGASKDGSRAFFTSTQQLTDQATESTGDAGHGACAESIDCNLYEYEGVTAKDPRTEGTLVDVSAGEDGRPVPGGPRVQGVFTSSPEGNTIYFVAKGVLTEAPNDRREVAVEGADNLYVYERDAEFPAGRTAFIAALPDTDASGWNGNELVADVTPEGRIVVFRSHGDLTSDDTSLSGAIQVFRYDAATAQLIRISIGNRGFDDNGNRSQSTPCINGAQRCSEDAEIVAPEQKRWEFGPTMSDAGTRVFFASPVGLAPGALDDVFIGENEGSGLPQYADNVYEWEQEGTGSCPAGRSAGCVFLISDGRDVYRENATLLLGTDATGKNVFFGTTDQLLPSDSNNEFNYYDARVCEPENGNPCISEPPPALPPCNEEACHGIPAAQLSAPTGGTLTLNGQGNPTSFPRQGKPAPRALTRAQKLAAALRTCKKVRATKKRAACVRQAKTKYGPKARAKKTDRRAGR